METLELLAHPVRLRIVHAMRGERTLTTGDLCALLPDVSKAQVYRHVDLLAAGGILEVAGERRVRGAVERRFRLRTDRASIDPAAAAALTADDHRRAFATAMAALIAEFNAYLDGAPGAGGAVDGGGAAGAGGATGRPADPVGDLVGYRQHAVWLSHDELVDLIGDLRAAILPRLANRAAEGRDRYLLSPILFPSGEKNHD